MDSCTQVDSGYLVKLRQGERFVIPEGYLYTFVNASGANILFSRVYKKSNIVDYAQLKRERGLAYYCIRKNGHQEIVLNPFYKNTPAIIELTADKPLIKPIIKFHLPLYNLLKSELDLVLTKLA